MKACKHTRNGVDLFIRKRADGQDWDPMTPTCDQGPPVAWRCCRCGEYASLGPANDTTAAMIELRAAELAHGVDNEAEFTNCEWMGWNGDEAYTTSPPLEWHTIDELPPMKLSRWHAGYLARVIVEHTEES